MAKFRVVYTCTKIDEEVIEAKNYDDAKAKWEAEGLDAELFFIEDEDSETRIYL